MTHHLRNTFAIIGLGLSITGLAIIGDFPRGAFEAAGVGTGALLMLVGVTTQLAVKYSH